MTGRQIELAIAVAVDAEKAQANLRDVGDAAKDMASDIDAAADKAERASRSLDGVGDAADSVATNTSILAGAMGDIAGGLEGIGLDGLAGGLNALSTPLMFAAGLGDTLSVTLETLRGSTLAAKAATIGKTIAEKAAAVATKAMAVGQLALNAAMSANPIGLVVIAIVALVAGLVLAYKKSETFRKIVQAVGRAGKAAIGWIVDKIGDLVGWVKSKAPAAFNTLKSVAIRALNAIPIVVLVRKAGDLVGWIKDKLPAAFNAAKSTATRVLNAITAPIRSLIDFVSTLIDKIKSIHWPSPPGWVKDLGSGVSHLFGGRLAVPSAGGSSSSAAAPIEVSSSLAPTVTYNITIQGAVDPVATARQIQKLLIGQNLRLGTI